MGKIQYWFLCRNSSAAALFWPQIPSRLTFITRPRKKRAKKNIALGPVIATLRKGNRKALLQQTEGKVQVPCEQLGTVLLNTTSPSAGLWMPTKHSSADTAATNTPQSMDRILNVIKTNKIITKNTQKKITRFRLRNFLVLLQVYLTGSCAFCHQMTNTYGANSFPWNHPVEPHPSIPDLLH